MPRKTNNSSPAKFCGCASFNEAAARCRGKPDAGDAIPEGDKELQ